jgi:hypothetical protein
MRIPSVGALERVHQWDVANSYVTDVLTGCATQDGQSFLSNIVEKFDGRRTTFLIIGSHDLI